MIETKKIPKFRIIIKDIESNKHKTITVYNINTELEVLAKSIETHILEHGNEV